MRNNYKEVYFENYCNKCIYEKKEEHEDPCSDCLSYGVLKDSHRPLKFKKK